MHTRREPRRHKGKETVATWLAIGLALSFPAGLMAADQDFKARADKKSPSSYGLDGKTKPKPDAKPVQRRPALPRETATVTPFESPKAHTQSTTPTADEPFVYGTGTAYGTENISPAKSSATAMPIESAPAGTPQALPTHRRRPIDFEAATVEGPAAQAPERAYPVHVAGETPVGRVADQRRDQMPAEDNNSDLYKGNRVTFRGGYVSMLSNRSGEIFTDVGGAIGNNPADKGYYVGASLDMLLACNLWGLLKNASALGEINVEYKHLNSERVASAVPSLATGSPVPDKVDVTMLTVSISPKIKFNDGQRFRPWIIPVGLDVHVISPPSNRTQYLDIGAQFGAGAEFQVWREFKVGVEGRFHLAANQTQTVNSFWNAGPYVSIGF